jgi:hypothetical protein
VRSVLGRTVVVVLLLLASLIFVAPSRANAACANLVGPGIPPPGNLTYGIEGFHAAWYGQSGYMSLCPGSAATATVGYYNTGTRGWVLGRMGEAAYLGTWEPIPGQDKASTLGGDGTNGSPATGWPRFNRIAMQPAPYVGPGQVAWFQFRVVAPMTPGRYVLALRPLIEGAQWMEDYGVFWVVTVLSGDGTVPPTPSPTPSPTSVSFGDGTKIIGVDIPPGTYRTRVAASGCYRERLSGFGGTLDDILANDLTDYVSVVTIAATDRGFKTSRCGIWTSNLSAITLGQTQPFGDGTFIVSTDIAPGLWRAPGGGGCYWQRLSGFGGTLDDINANGLGDVSPVVTITATDKGFHSSRCGLWTKIG